MLLNINKLDLKEKILKLISMENLLEKEMMDIGFHYRTGLVVLLNVVEVPKLYIENVFLHSQEDKIVSENQF